MRWNAIHPGVPLTYGHIYRTELAGLGGLAGLDGMSQAWYSRVQGVEERLLMLDNKVFAIGSEAWLFVAQQAQAKRMTELRDGYSTVKAGLRASIADIVGQDEEKITDAQLVLADRRIAQYSPQADFVAAMIKGTPKAAVVAIEQAKLSKVINNLPAKNSPSAVYRKTLLNELTSRTGALSFGIAKLLLPVAVVIGGIVLLKRKL